MSGGVIVYDAPLSTANCRHRQPFKRWAHNPGTIWLCNCETYCMVGEFGLSFPMSDAYVAEAREAGVIP